MHAAREGRAYSGQALVIGSGKSARTVMLVSTPVMYGGRFLGMIGAVEDLQFLIRRLQEVNRGGLTPYVVDSEGRLVAGATPDYATGQDLTNSEIVRNFRGAGRPGSDGCGHARIQRDPGQEKHEDARHLQPGGQSGLGGDRAEAARTRLTAGYLRCSAAPACWR